MESFILTGNKSYVGFIENTSITGFEFTLEAVQEELDDIYRGDSVSIVLQTPAGDALNLSCTVQWMSGGWPVSTSLTLGLQITTESSKFNRLIDTLDIVSIN
jgi:hypothetical protein